MYALIQSNLEQIFGVYLFGIVFDDHQMGFFIVMSNAHYAFVCSYNFRYFHTTIVAF